MIFDRCFPLLLELWNSRGWNDFANYMQNSWGRDCCRWYEGAALTHPSTNNGLESLNRQIKDKYTLRKMMPMGEFLNACESMTTDWSEQSLNKGFKKEPEIPPATYLRLMTAGYQFSQKRPDLISARPDLCPGKSAYLIPTDDCCCSEAAFLAPIFDATQFTAFGEYKRWLKWYYLVENVRGWFSCTCPVGHQVQRVCSHCGHPGSLPWPRCPYHCSLTPTRNRPRTWSSVQSVICLVP